MKQAYQKLIFILLFATGCGSNFGLSERKTVSSLTFTDEILQDKAALKQVFGTVEFNQPIYITSAHDESNRLFVVEKTGRIRVFHGESDQSPTTFLDLSSVISTESAEGLLGLAFDPDFENNGYFYVHYTKPSPRRAVISRFTTSLGDPDVGDAGSELIILEVQQPAARHKGGMVEFGPDGYLYASFGDGGLMEPTPQDTTNLHGAVIRIDVSGATVMTPYVIPPTNPFVGQVGFREEIWAYGFRNPWRFSFDRVNGDLWLGDVGENNWEEINVVISGGNYGWNLFEAFDAFDNPTNIPFSSTVPPTMIYPHNQLGGSSVTGGYVYRGSDISWLVGKYVYSDYGDGSIMAYTPSNESIEQIAWTRHITGFGEDEDGELFAVSIDGAIYKIVKNTSTNNLKFPHKLSETGFFKDLSTMETEEGIIEYDLNIPFWSDGLFKRRWVALPGDKKVVFSEGAPWEFPIGTVICKHFEWNLGDGNKYKVETRFIVNHKDGWAGYTYEWNDTQTDATLIDQGKLLTLTKSGKTLNWTLPSRGQCLSCHNMAAGYVLGMKTRQLNKNFEYERASDNQLRAWNHIGLFTKDIGEVEQYDKYTRLTDTSVPLTRRAKSYLDVNCSQCHQPGVNSDLGMDFRFATKLEDMSVKNVNAQSVTPGYSNTKRLKPGDKNKSEMYIRMTTNAGTHMPPLGTNKNDAAGAEMIGDWIESLE